MSPRKPDEVAEVIAAFVDYLEGRGPRPSVEHLRGDRRREAEHLMRLIEAGRGIDPARIPALDVERVGALMSGAAPSRGMVRGGGVGRVRAELESMGRPDVAVEADTAAGAVGAKSDLIVRVAGLRIRVMVLEGLSTSEQISDPGLLSEADRLFYRFPETAAVAIVADDSEYDCVVVEPHEVRPGIGTPHGRLEPPKPARPPLPLRSAITGYLDGVEPIWDEVPGFRSPIGENFSAAKVGRTAATAAIHDLLLQGSRAHTAAKKETWSALGERETESLAALAVEVSKGQLGADGLMDRLDAIVGDAA